MELMQKQMMMLFEQQQKAAAVNTSTGGSVAPPTTAPGEMFQFPLPLLTFGLPATPLQVAVCEAIFNLKSYVCVTIKILVTCFLRID